MPPADPFTECFEGLIIAEGGYSDQAADRGGKTKYGITEAVARASGYIGPMQDLSKDIAKDIYRRRYWNSMRLDEVSATVSLRVAAELFDTAVNMGVTTAGRFLQTALNALNRNGSDYADINPDGLIGPGTLSALRAYAKIRASQDGIEVLMTALKCQQGARYLDIAARDHTQERWVFGWLRNRV